MFLSALLLAQAGSVLAGMTDAQFCDAFQRNIAQVPEQVNPPFRTERPSVDCSARRIRVTIHLAASGEDVGALQDAWVANARSGVCNLANPNMAAFHNRGWRWAYRFIAEDGEATSHTLEC